MNEELEAYKTVLIHIATMECYTREGENPAHKLMMDLAKGVLDKYKKEETSRQSDQMNIQWDKTIERNTK